MGQATTVLEGVGGTAVIDEIAGSFKIPVGTEGAALLSEVVRRLDEAGVKLADLALHRPTLDDVFLKLTGHGAEEDADDGVASGQGRWRKKEGAA